MLSKAARRAIIEEQGTPLILLIIGIAVVPLDRNIATHIVIVSLSIFIDRAARKKR